ncbi:tetratricopeptide repeat protein [candidate division KSB1 bacterium]
MSAKKNPAKNKKRIQKGIKPASPEKQIIKNPSKYGDRPAYIVLLILSFLIYSNTIFFDYTLDDRMIITSNEFTKEGFKGMDDIMTNDSFTGFFGKQKKLVAGGRYRPLSQLMFAAEYEFFGEKPLISHLINVLLYMLTAIVLFRTSKTLFRDFKSTKWFLSIPFLASIIFVVHPVHTEVVANIKGRDEILSFLGALFSLFFVLRFIDTKKNIHLVWTGIAMFLAMLAKENAITFLVVIPLSLFFFRKNSTKDSFITLVPIIAAVAIYLILRKAALGYLISSEKVLEILNNPYARSTASEKYATIFFTWLLYIKLLVFPHPLTHDYYPFHIAITNFSNIWVIIAILIYLVLGIFALIKFRKKHFIAYSIFFFLITFSISSNLVFNIGTFMNERFLYAPSFGFALVVAYFLGISFKDWMKNQRSYQNMILVILIIICAAGSIKSFSRNNTWKDDYTLFTTDVKTSVNSTKCNVSAGEAVLRKAQEVSNKEQQKRYFEEASIHFFKAVEIYPGSMGGWHLNGTTLTNLQRYKEALVCYQNGLNLQPDESKTEILLNEISILAKNAYAKKEVETATNAFQLLLKYKPDNLEYQILLADVYASGNRMEDGLQMLKSLTEKYPDNYLAYNKLGRIYGEKLQDLEKSLFYLTKAYELKNDDPSTLENLGIVYAMLQNYNQAVFFFEKAVKLSPGNTRLLNNLGNTYVVMGEQEKADACFAEAKKQ